VAFILNPWSDQTEDMHLCHAAIAGKLANDFAGSLLGGNLLHQLADDVPQPVRLLLPRGVTGDAARILNASRAMLPVV
jgi:hypothetical protein